MPAPNPFLKAIVDTVVDLLARSLALEDAVSRGVTDRKAIEAEILNQCNRLKDLPVVAAMLTHQDEQQAVASLSTLRTVALPKP